MTKTSATPPNQQRRCKSPTRRHAVSGRTPARSSAADPKRVGPEAFPPVLEMVVTAIAMAAVFGMAVWGEVLGAWLGGAR